VESGITSTSTSSDATARQTSTDFHLGKVGLVYRFGEARPLSAMAAMPPAPGTAWGDGWAGPYYGAYFGAGAGRARESSTRTNTSTSNDGTNLSATNGSSAGNLAGDMTGSTVDLFAGYTTGGPAISWPAGRWKEPCSVTSS
jgi:hypothetical protein